MDEQQANQHQCRQHRRCRDATTTAEGETLGAGVERAGTLCPECEQHAFDAIRELWTDYQLLAAAMLFPRGRIDGPKITRTADRKVPIPLDVDTLMTAIDDETLRWTLRITKGDPLPAASMERVHRCTAILCANTGTLVDLPIRRFKALLPLPDGGDHLGAIELDGVDAVLRLAELHHKTRSVLGLTEITTWLAESCHVCGMRTLTAAVKNNTVKCRNCRQVWDQAEFARLNNVLEPA